MPELPAGKGPRLVPDKVDYDKELEKAVDIVTNHWDDLLIIMRDQLSWLARNGNYCQRECGLRRWCDVLTVYKFANERPNIACRALALTAGELEIDLGQLVKAIRLTRWARSR